MNKVLEVAGITAGYGKTVILRSVSLDVYADEIVCIAGPNGAGKSTLLKAIVGIVPLLAGEITIFGRTAQSGETDDDARRALGMVPQVNNVFPSLSVRENMQVVMPRTWNARQRRDAEDRVHAAIEGLGTISGTMASRLSGGQRQSLAFAMALVREPKLMVLDEPTAALSPMAAQSVFERIVHLKRNGIPILLVEQNVKPAMAISDRAYFLENGRNFMDGPVAEVRDDPRIKKIYLGG